MKNSILKLIFGLIVLVSNTSIAQNDQTFENSYMNCMYSLFEDNGAELKSLIKKAEQKLIAAELLPDASGKSYITLFKNIRTAIDGRISSFGVSDYVINSLLNSKNAKKYSKCMDTMMKDANFGNSKISKFIAMSTSGNNPKITDLTSKMLEIFEAKDFEHDFYKYLTFSLIDKYNTANKK
ncbi:MAG: hypothetical protein AAF611_19640 [Bacteroidota bacterium]